MAPYFDLIEQVKKFALPPVSKFYVGSLAIGKSGRLYPGVNVEFQGADYAASIHGEQFLHSLVRHHNKDSIATLIVSAEPCGHCRQFMLEGGNPELPIIHQVQSLNKDESNLIQKPKWNSTTLKELLPNPFTLAKDTSNMFSSPLHKLAAIKEKLNPVEKKP